MDAPQHRNHQAKLSSLEGRKIIINVSVRIQFLDANALVTEGTHSWSMTSPTECFPIVLMAAPSDHAASTFLPL